MATQGAADNRSLHELAVDIVQDIHMLATGLAHAGAPPQVTSQIDQTSELYAGVAKALAAGPVGAQPGDAGPPQGQPAAGGPPPPGASMGAPPPQPQPQNSINGSSPTGAAHGDMHNAIVEMHKASVNAASRR
jgi:hypothetical protein